MGFKPRTQGLINLSDLQLPCGVPKGLKTYWTRPQGAPETVLVYDLLVFSGQHQGGQGCSSHWCPSHTFCFLLNTLHFLQESIRISSGPVAQEWGVLRVCNTDTGFHTSGCSSRALPLFCASDPSAVWWRHLRSCFCMHAIRYKENWLYENTARLVSQTNLA